MKKFIKNTLSALPFVRHYLHGKAIILMLHRIAPIDPHKLPENENMKISPEALESFILQAKAQGYSFISLDTLHEYLLQDHFPTSKNLIITIDDGYQDNFTYGFEIFKKHQIPFCIYLCTNFLTNPNMWWFSLEDFLLEREHFELDSQTIKITTMREKSQAFLTLRRYILSNLNSNISTLMDKLAIPHTPSSHKELTLTQEQISQMLEYEGFTLGNHTHSHPVFNNLSFEDLRADITQANQLIEQKFGFKPKHFAFPFGGTTEINTKYCDFIKSLQFKTCTTTRHGTIYPEHKDFLHVLPRVFLSNSSNLKNLIRIRKQKIVTY